jgi:hypothetical protein
MEIPGQISAEIKSLPPNGTGLQVKGLIVAMFPVLSTNKAMYYLTCIVEFLRIDLPTLCY